MQLKVNKIFFYDDFGPHYYFYDLYSSKLRNINLDLGENLLIFNDQEFKKTNKKSYYPEPLFPAHSIKPIHHSNLDKNSLIIISLNYKTLLYNSTLKLNQINMELKVSSQYKLNYLFFGFGKVKTFSLRPRIVKDEFSLIQALENDMLNSNLRQYFIDLITSSEAPKSGDEIFKYIKSTSGKDTSNEDEDYRIIDRGSSFDISFGKDYSIIVPKTKGIQVIVYKIFHPDVKDPIEIEKTLFDKSEKNVVSAWRRCEKNYRNAILRIEKEERENKLTKLNRFSKYVFDSIKFKEHNSSIIFKKKYRKNWEPEGFQKNFISQ